MKFSNIFKKIKQKFKQKKSIKHNLPEPQKSQIFHNYFLDENNFNCLKIKTWGGDVVNISSEYCGVAEEIDLNICTQNYIIEIRKNFIKVMAKCKSPVADLSGFKAGAIDYKL